MKRKVSGLLTALLACILLCGSAVQAASDGTPSYVKIPKEGGYTIGEEEASRKTETGYGVDTDFYLYIEYPKAPGSGSGSSSGGSHVTVGTKLPKTKDTGTDLNTLLLLALVCGAGYLFCEYHAKKKA